MLNIVEKVFADCKPLLSIATIPFYDMPSRYLANEKYFLISV